MNIEGFSIVAVRDFDEDVLSTFLQEASRDSLLCTATYLPPQMSDEDARSWASARENTAWVVVYEGRPVGWWEFGPVKCSCGFVLPEGTFEREVWLVEEFRGRRFIREATHLLAAELLAREVKYLVGIAWEDNRSAIHGMSRGGFDRLGRGWWRWGDEIPGWCELWLLDLSIASVAG